MPAMADADAATDAIPEATAERRLREGFRVVVIKGPDRGRALIAQRPKMTSSDAAARAASSAIAPASAGSLPPRPHAPSSTCSASS